jgi:hypothetical protein
MLLRNRQENNEMALEGYLDMSPERYPKIAHYGYVHRKKSKAGFVSRPFRKRHHTINDCYEMDMNL